MPEGFRYVCDLLSVEEEEGLARELEALPFKPFDFHGYQANRQVVGFGFRYDYSRREVVEAPPVPTFLDPVRQRIGEAFDRPPEAFEQVLINEYRPGAGIGWHRDRLVFEHVVGVSLGAPATMRFRRRKAGGFDRASAMLAPRSIYHLDGAARYEWEHSIAPMDVTRWSIVYRSLSKKA